MISSAQIRLTMRAPLLAAAVVPDTDIAWEARKFDPANRNIWIRETLLPVQEEHIAQNTPAFAGIMVYDVFTPATTGTETVEGIVKTLGDVYSPDNAPLIGTGVKIVIESVSRKTHTSDGAWQFIPVHVLFNAFDS